MHALRTVMNGKSRLLGVGLVAAASLWAAPSSGQTPPGAAPAGGVPVNQPVAPVPGAGVVPATTSSARVLQRGEPPIQVRLSTGADISELYVVTPGALAL